MMNVMGAKHEIDMPVFLRNRIDNMGLLDHATTDGDEHVRFNRL